MKKKQILPLLLLLILFGSCGSVENTKININEDWRFIRLEKDAPGYILSSVDFDDKDWEYVALPHTPKLEPLVVNDQWQGICWYRKKMDISKNLKGKRIFIELEAAMNYSQIWMNGEMLLENQGGFLPIVLDISEKVNFGEKNVLSVRLVNKDNAITGPKPLHLLDFNMYGGLYRNAWMIVKEPIYISNPILAQEPAGGGIFIATLQCDSAKANIEVKSHIVNTTQKNADLLLEQVILYNDSVICKQEKSVKLAAKNTHHDVQQIAISSPYLWSPNTPHLYVMMTNIYKDGKLVDSEKTRFGIREFKFSGSDLYINGIKTTLMGVNRHQEYPFVGYALSDNAQYRDAQKIKNAGFNYVRLSHYPHSTAFMNACDELGLVVIDAILGWQYYIENDDFRNYCFKSSRNLVKRDRNHPCVLAWEVSLNETMMPLEFRHKLDSIAHAEYPYSNCYTAGWQDEGWDIYLQARQHKLEFGYNDSLTKPYVVSEYGDWEYYAMNGGYAQELWNDLLPAQRSSRQFRSDGEKRLLQQTSNIMEAYNDNRNTRAFADSYWVMYDYNRGYASDIESSGIMDIFRLPKFSYYFYKSQSNPQLSEPLVFIASNWTSQSSPKILILSNCEEVALYLNDKLISRKETLAIEKSKNIEYPPRYFEVDKFEAGTLKAIGYINHQKVCEHIVSTPKAPKRMDLEVDFSGKEAQAGVNDILFVYCRIVDENGMVIPDYNESIDCEIKGDATLLNVDQIKAEAGIATLLVKIGDSAGKIKIKTKKAGLETGYVEFISKK